MPIKPTERLFVYGFISNRYIIYIGKANNLLNRFIGHIDSGSVFSYYLKYILHNNEDLGLIIFGYHEKRIADILERKLIKSHSTCTFLLNDQLRETEYAKSWFVNHVIEITKDTPYYVSIPKSIKNKLIIIQKNYIKRYATIEETREVLDYPTTISK